MIKQVIVMRKDLGMRKGKMIAQGAHASMKVIFDRMKTVVYDTVSKHSPPEKRVVKELELSTPTKYAPLREWIEGSFIKIVVGCNSLEELLELKRQAHEAKIINAMIIDSGATEFKIDCPKCDNEEWTGIHCNLCNGTGQINKETITCLAIGPDESDKIDRITGHLKLL